MNKKQAKEKAIDVLMSNLSIAYYEIEEGMEGEDLTEEEKEKVHVELRKLAQKMAKAIGKEYYTQ